MEDKKRGRGAPRGNKNALGNKGGAPKGNTNAVGNRGGGAPINNTNAITHGMFSFKYMQNQLLAYQVYKALERIGSLDQLDKVLEENQY